MSEPVIVDHDDMVPCDNCGTLTDDPVRVVAQPGERMTWSCPASDPVLEDWCRKCAANSHAHYGVVREFENERERGDDDGVEYGDPRGD